MIHAHLHERIVQLTVKMNGGFTPSPNLSFLNGSIELSLECVSL